MIRYKTFERMFFLHYLLQTQTNTLYTNTLTTLNYEIKLMINVMIHVDVMLMRLQKIRLRLSRKIISLQNYHSHFIEILVNRYGR
jgi:hypothetical protein